MNSCDLGRQEAFSQFVRHHLRRDFWNDERASVRFWTIIDEVRSL